MASFLRKNGIGQRDYQIQDVTVHRDNGSYLPDGEIESVRTSTIKHISRRGKFLLFTLDNGTLVGHNAMSGYWDFQDHPWTFDYVEGKRVASERDVRVSIRIHPCGPDRSSERILRYHDARLFGSLRFYDREKSIPSLNKLGPEPFFTECVANSFNFMSPDELSKALEKRPRLGKRTIKEVLMDQSVIVGVGNIYASEILWRAGIHPERSLSSLVDNEKWFVVSMMKGILRDAIESNINYDLLKVYRQEFCKICGEKISMIKIKGRSSYFCPRCQVK